MSVSIYLQRKRGKPVDITPGLGSMMERLLYDNDLLWRELSVGDVETLVRIARVQELEADPDNTDFNWCIDIAGSVYEIVKELWKTGYAKLDAQR